MFAEKDRAAAESVTGVASKTVGQKKSMGGSDGSAVSTTVTVGAAVVGIGVGLFEMVGLGEREGDVVGASVGAIEIVGATVGEEVGLRVANRSQPTLAASTQVGVKASN